MFSGFKPQWTGMSWTWNFMHKRWSTVKWKSVLCLVASYTHNYLTNLFDSFILFSYFLLFYGLLYRCREDTWMGFELPTYAEYWGFCQGFQDCCFCRKVIIITICILSKFKIVLVYMFINLMSICGSIKYGLNILQGIQSETNILKKSLKVSFFWATF